MKKIVCPECGTEVGNLLQHVKRHHKDIITREDFYRYYPDYVGKFSVAMSKRQPGEYKCPYCTKVYPFKNSLQLHIKKCHPEFYQKLKKKPACIGQTCPICGSTAFDMKQHVKVHGCSNWEDFCKKYSWNEKDSKIVSEEYRKHLSENKKNYYRSEEGLKRKLKQSEEQKKCNFGSSALAKERSMESRAKKGTHAKTGLSLGLKIKYEDYTFRSYLEFKFYIYCRLQGINLKYEPVDFRVKWYNNQKKFLTTYMPDFWYEDKKVLLELKPEYTVEAKREEEKYRKVLEVYNKLHISYFICSPSMFFERFLPEVNIFSLKLQFEQWIRQEVSKGTIIFYIPGGYSPMVSKDLNIVDLKTLDCVVVEKDVPRGKHKIIENDKI